MDLRARQSGGKTEQHLTGKGMPPEEPAASV
jgi:hypothetical protein